MSVRLVVAECGKCGQSAGLEWARTPLGVDYLREIATGAEHLRACHGVSGPRLAPEPVRPVREPAPVRVSYSAPPAPVVAEPEPVDLVAEPEEIAPPADFEQWIADGDAYAQVDAERAASATRADLAGMDWPAARRAILACGGIGPSPDWPRDWIPGDLYREHGQAPDIVAEEATVTTAGGASALPWIEPDEARMFDWLHRAWEDWQRAQEARRPRPRRVKPEPARQPAQALAEPAHASPRDLLADVARLVADVADLVAYASTDAERTRYARMARTAAELAGMVRDDG